jgi:hypothetical protein
MIEPKCPDFAMLLVDLFKHSYKVCPSLLFKHSYKVQNDAQYSSAVEDAAITNIQTISNLAGLARMTFGPHCTPLCPLQKRIVPDHSPQAPTNAWSITSASDSSWQQTAMKRKCIWLLLCSCIHHSHNRQVCVCLLSLPSQHLLHLSFSLRYVTV